MWTPDGRRIAFASHRADKATPNIYWQRSDGTGETQRLTESKNPQYPASWHPSGGVLAFHERSPETALDIMILKVEGDEISGFKPGKPTAFLSTPYLEVEAAFSPDGRWVAYQSNESGRFEVYVRPFPGPGGKWQVSTGGGSIPTWSRSRKELLYRTPELTLMVAPYSAEGAFSPDGNALASSGCGKIGQRILFGTEQSEVCVEGEIRLWSVATRQQLGQPFTGHTDEIQSIAFSLDGKTLASASGRYDGTIKLWDVATRQPTGRPFTGYVTYMNKVIFSPDGDFLASSADFPDDHSSKIFLWDVATGQLIGQPLVAHTENIEDIAFSPDGKMLASGGGDSDLLLWNISLDSWITSACRIANRNMTRAEWERYLPDQPYRKTCPNLPEPPRE